jgi:hypothetical protein
MNKNAKRKKMSAEPMTMREFKILKVAYSDHSDMQAALSEIRRLRRINRAAIRELRFWSRDNVPMTTIAMKQLLAKLKS